jgi:CAP-Gly domain-containing linker protein 3/4
LVLDIDSPCSEFDNGTPLHIAARNLAVDSASILLLHGAYPHAKDSLGKMPIGTLFRNFLSS